MDTTTEIKSHDLTLHTLYNEFYTVPDFQREYVWQEKNVEKLLNDVYEHFYDSHNQPSNDAEYFVGSTVVCWGKDNAYLLIDGQQRLTTCYLLLCAARDLLDKSGATNIEWLRKIIADISMDPVTKNDLYRFKIILQYTDSDGVLKKIAEGKTLIKDIKITTRSVHNIITAYNTIASFFGEKFQNIPDKVREFVAVFIDKVKIIRIETPHLKNALKVFETINARGVGLSPMDLLKNLVFMQAKSNYSELKGRWDKLIKNLERCDEKPTRFLRYYILSHYKINDSSKGLREDEIYDWFNDKADLCGINLDPLGFVDKLIDRSAAYANFVEGKDVAGNTNRYLKNLKALSGTARQHFILLLAGQHLQPELFNELSRQIENLFFCYIITREATKTFERDFADWSGELRDVKDADGINAFINKNIINEMKSLSERFDLAINKLNLTEIQQYRMRYILAKLTQYIEEKAWGNPVDTNLDRYIHSSVHIEHILPYDPKPEVKAAFDKILEYDNFKQRLGNLTLLEQTINSSIGNDFYEAKKDGYRHSAFLLTKSLIEKQEFGIDTQLKRAVEDLQQFDNWDSNSIEARQEMLRKLARRVWGIPDITENLEIPHEAKQ